MYFFFFHKLQLIIVLFLIHDSFSNWSTRFVALKAFLWFSILDSISFLLKSTFMFKKSMVCLTFNVIIKVTGKPHMLLVSDLWFWGCRKNFSFSFSFNFSKKFSDMCELKVPKTWSGEEFFRLGKLNFWEQQFCSKGTN